MKKRLITTICIGILFLFPISVFAHSGRTDGSGGHHDGEDYHYHHGQPAHDHWDMDGDGILDCPYEFKDKTGQNSGSSSGTKKPSTNNNATASTTSSAAETPGSTNGVHPLIWVVVGILLAWVIYRFVRRRRNNQKVLQSLNCKGVSVPWGVVLLPDGTPTSGAVSDYRPYGDYTVYLSPTGKKIHARPRCCRNLTAFHLFDVPSSYAPCKSCAKGIQIPHKLPDWYCEIMNAKAKTPYQE